MHTSTLDVLDFWFGPTDDPGHGQPRKAWFVKDPAFDAEINRRFGPLIEQALVGGIDDWLTQPLDALPALARVIVLDQFTRNVFRNTARAFAGDAAALQTARALVATGADRSLTSVQRSFVYLPFEHAEDISMQQQSLNLFDGLAAEHPALGEAALWAHKHQQVVQRFGRYPHRNTILGRQSTPEELAFLAQPGSSF